MISNFVDGAARFFVHNVVTVGRLSVIAVPLFSDDVALVVPNTEMILGNFKPLILETTQGSSYEDFEFLALSCEFISPDLKQYRRDCHFTSAKMNMVQVKVESMPPTTFDLKVSLGSVSQTLYQVLSLTAQPVVSGLYP